MQILALRPGISQTFEPDSKRIRICSLSSGKVKVRFDTLEEEFFIGHRGVFTIKRGRQCIVENWFYEEATITVFSTGSRH